MAATTTARRPRGLLSLALALTTVLALVLTGLWPSESAGPGDGADGGGLTDVGRTDVEVALDEDPDCFGIQPAGLAADAVTCGAVAVPLEHDEPGGEQIELAVAVHHADQGDAAGGGAGSATERRAPLLLLGGGPGEVMVEPYLTTPQLRHVFDVDRDVIVVDQRGVGSSSPALECPEIPALEAQETAEESLQSALEALGDCHDRLVAEGIDLDGFDHLNNARDVDLVRRAVGADELNIRGTSYGTQVALLAADMFPDATRSVILSSPLDPRENWIETAPEGFERALDRVVELCAADDACAEEVGDLDAAIEQVVERLAEDPEEVTARPPGGEPEELVYDPAGFLGGLFTLFYQAQLTASLPAFVDAAADGDLSPLADLSALLAQQLEGALSAGMQYSMVCSGEGALASAEDARASLDSELLAEHWFGSNMLGEPMAEVCDIWDVEHDYDPAAVSLDIEAPTLILTGGLDHVTPPRLGEQLHADLPQSQLIEVPGATHGPLETVSLPGPCGQRLVGAFLADPGAELEAACATGVRPFVTTSLPAGFR